MFTKQSVCLCILVGCFASVSVRADSDFSAKLTDWTSKTKVINSVYTGLYTFTIQQIFDPTEVPVDAGGSPLGAGDKFDAHCIERYQAIHTSTTYNFDVVPLSEAPLHSGGSYFTATQQSNLVTLWAIEFQKTSGNYTFKSGLTGKDRHAAAQLAIWSITDNLDISGSGTDKANARDFIAEMNTNAGSYFTSTDVRAMVNKDTQDFIGLFSASQTVVPVPAAAWVGMMLLGGMGVVRKLRGRREHAA